MLKINIANLTPIYLAFAPIMFGIVAKKYKLVNEDTNTSISKFVFYIAMPIQLFMVMSHSQLTEIFNLKYIAAFIVTTFIIWFIIFTISQLFFLNKPTELALILLSAGQVNTAYIAIPIFIICLKDASPVIPITIFQVLVLTTIVILIIEKDLQNRGKRAILTTSYRRLRFMYIVLNNITRNPLALATIIGIIISFYGIIVPSFVVKGCNLISYTCSPLALFTLGFSLFDKEETISKKERYEIAIFVFLKTIIHPLLAFIVGKKFFALNYHWLTALVLIAAMPSPKNTIILAHKYNISKKKTGLILLNSTIISIIIIFLILNLIIF